MHSLAVYRRSLRQSGLAAFLWDERCAFTLWAWVHTFAPRIWV